jgi:four helix bundle protein
MKQQELEDRLLRFSVNVVNLTKHIKRTPLSAHLIGQLVRSATAPALMYAEACAAESAQDFIHKMSMALKELRETKVNLRMILLNGLVQGPSIDNLLDENEQLIAIFWKSIDTARCNRLN